MRLTLDYLVALLASATSHDATARVDAAKAINKYVVDADKDYYRLLLQLVSDQTKDPGIRKQAAIQAKNFMRFVDVAMRQHHLEVWHAFRQRERADLVSSLFSSLADPVVSMYMANILSAVLEAEMAVAHNSVKLILDNIRIVYMDAKQASPKMREEVLNIFVYFYEDVSPAEAQKLDDPSGIVEFCVKDAIGTDPTPGTMSAGLKILTQKFKYGALDPTFVCQLLGVLLSLGASHSVLLTTPIMAMLIALLTTSPDALTVNDGMNTQVSLPLSLAVRITTLAKTAYIAQSGSPDAEQAHLELQAQLPGGCLPSGYYHDPLANILAVLEFWNVMATTQLIGRSEFSATMMESLVSGVLLPLIFSDQFTEQSIHATDVGNIKDAASITLGYIVSSSVHFYTNMFPLVFKSLEALFQTGPCKDPSNLTGCLQDLNIFLIIRAFICKVADGLPESHTLTPQITWLLNLTFDRVSFIVTQNATEGLPHFMPSLSVLAAELVTRLAEQMPKRLTPLIELYLNKCVQPLLYNKLPSGKIMGYGLQVFTYFYENAEICQYLIAYLPPILQHVTTEIANFVLSKDEVNAGALIQAGNQHAELITACFSEANSVEGLDKCLSFFITVLKDIGPRILTSNGDEMPAGTSFMEMVLTYMTQTLVSYAYCSSKNFNVDLILSALTLVLQLLLEIYTRVDLDKVQMAAADFIIQAIFIENLIPQISTCIQEWLQPGVSVSTCSTPGSTSSERPTLLAICGHFIEVNVDAYHTHHTFVALVQSLLHLTSPDKMELVYKIMLSRFNGASTIKTKEAIVLLLFEATRLRYLSFQSDSFGSQACQCYTKPIEELYRLLKDCSLLCKNGVRTDKRGLKYVSVDLAQLSKATVKLFEMVLYTSVTNTIPLDVFLESMSGSIETIIQCHTYEDESIQLNLKMIYNMPFKGIFLSMFTIASARVAMLSNYACRSSIYSFLKKISNEVEGEVDPNYSEIHRSFLNACSSLITGSCVDK
ncbi:hypothetical protein GL50803_0014704 [Giardia duodenalis]|uniref:Uncharacterized protein n=1 Tax=Giardia intestinalis (strain ATCC 50803 / WB clone C6) TaxID=184922 RepID=A8B666_GIAIC|nr:hypothetical protein GL50803_0014704 [Giardia intestinalis]KAE8305027.1 hypothetical protein GL50803_0014704 [Giardia intestinalis]|eukprot:XP_001709395.1 Hypothetical protein GL50803_14704 [Giardia lamblia ATCC 50803]